VGLLLSATGCTNTSNSWNQNRGDIANTDQMLAGPSDRGLGTTATVFVGTTAVEVSPVIGNDGSVFVSTADGTGSGPGNALVEVSAGPAPAVIHKIPITGLISTPAVDDLGNVYVSVFTQDGTARIVGLSRSFGPVFNTVITGHVVTIGPPKIFKLNDQTLIFVIITGGDPAGGHLLVLDQGGKIISGGDVWFCGDVTSTGQPLPIALNPGHGAAIRRARADGQVYIVAAADFCGVRQILLVPGANAGDPPIVTAQNKFYDDDSDKLFSDPVITGEDQVLLATAHNNDTFWMRAYDLATTDEKWKQSLANWLSDSPALDPFQVSSAYGVQMLTGSQSPKLSKFDLANNGNIVTAPPPGVDNTASNIAVAGQRIFVVTQTAIQVFDLNLAFKGAVPVAGLSPLAVGMDGAVYGVDAKGNLFRIGP
jgi:hypothetical protein